MRILVKILLYLSFLQFSFAGTVGLLTLQSLDEATKAVLKKIKGKVLAAKSETIDGKTIHIIKVITDEGRVQHFKVDAETGRLLN